MGSDTRLPSLSALHAPSHPIVRVVAWGFRLLLHGWCASVKVRGLDRMLDVLHDEQRIRRGQGLLTYANHISVVDDPTLFGCIPAPLFRRAETTRWTLGASDIMFTNRILSHLFRSGQVLPTDRGRGVFQPALDHSIDLLERGGWVHVFPEGYVNLSRTANIRRFKWGAARILLETGGQAHDTSSSTLPPALPLPVVLPIWISGFDAIMPEPRGIPRWLPRPGANVTINFGRPINPSLDLIVGRMRGLIASPSSVTKGVQSSEEAIARTLDDVPTLASHYPIPSSSLFTTPVKLEPPDGVPWPVPLPRSRSARAVAQGLDTDHARFVRSFIAAELRAHLVKFGDECGGADELVHRLMPPSLRREKDKGSDPQTY